MPTFTDASNITWNYTLNGNNASIGTGTTIPGNATSQGAGLSGQITIPSKVGTLEHPVTGISQYALWKTAIASLTIPDSVLIIGDAACQTCLSLTSVSIGNSVTYISYAAFNECASLTSLTIGTSVTEIGLYAFADCSNLESVTIPDSVTTLAGNTFYNCTKLKFVTIGNSVQVIGSGVFRNTLIESLTIPNSVSGISSYAFTDCSGLTSVTIPNSVNFIGINAFQNCSGLTSVTIPNSVTTISTSTFANCSGLTSVTIPNSVTTIGNNAFQSCSGLTSVTIGTSVTTIGSYAFYLCTSLVSINIPDSVTTIGNNALESTSVDLTVTMKTKKIGTITYTSPATDRFFFGNSSTTLILPIPPPTMTITANVANNATTNNTTIELTFTSSASTTNFVVTDISLTNGTLSSSFTAISDTIYTATFTPNGQGACTIGVAAGAYTNATGQTNTASNTFTWTFDSVSPSMTIISTSGVASGSTTKNKPIELRFTSTEATNNFGEGDISFTNGTLSNFASSSPTVYTATFTPTGPGPVACTIDVLAGAYTDAATNLNNLATQFAFTYDSVPPDITITSTNVANNATTNNETIELTFTSSKPTTNFIKEDITVNNGTLSTPLTYISDTVYKAIFTPAGQGACTIDVAANKFTDAVGNGNTASSTFTWTFDSVSPNMDIISTSGVASGSTTNVNPLELRFTSTEATNNFGEGDISFTNGTLSNFASSSPTVYTATFTPSGTGPVACTIDVLAGAYTDAATNLNNLATQFTFTYDSVRPTMDISSNVTSGSTTNISPIELTFTSSKATNNFVKESITVTNGTLPVFTAISATVYTATFSPIGSGPVECAINVPTGAFTDAAGNGNTAATQYAFTFDSVPPTMDISSNVTSGSITNISPIELTFTSSEPITGFTRDDISFNKGTLSDTLNAISDTVYKAIFTPDEQGIYTIYVPAGTFTDATNLNNLATQFTFTFDSVPPTMDISSNVTSGSTTNNASIALTFISSKATTDFDETNIRVSNGTLSSLTTSDNTVYNAIFTRINTITEGQCTIDVDAGAYTDAAGNNNIAATTFIWNFETVSPNMTITATAGPSNIEIATGATTNHTPILLTFTSTEATTNFEYADISVTNGELGTLTTSDNMVYYATFTPDENGESGKTECSISVPADKFTDAVGNYNTASNTFTFTFDNTKPTITIESTTVTSGSTTKNTSIELTFTLSEVPTGFEYADISVTNGTLGTLTTSDNKVYYATFTPDENGATGKTECSISVHADKFTDAVGNYNTSSNTFAFTFDNTKPTITVESTTVTSGSTTNNSSIELTFTLSEVPTGFEQADISVTNGTLGTLTTQNNDNNVYYATFTPDESGVTGKTECSISVPADKFTDAVGNYNTASNTFTFTFDNTKPTITIESTTVTSGSTTKNTPILLTFTLSEVPSGFEYADISVTNGTLSTLTTSDNKVYYATFAPDESDVSGKTECSISVPAVKFIDAVGNSNTASNIFSFTFDNTKPAITITSTTVATGSTTKNTPILLTFTLTEVPTGFEYADISVINGELGTLTTQNNDNTVYYATFTPDESGVSGKTECSISVPADKFTDAVGNYNTASNTFTFTFDSVRPTMNITATASGLPLANNGTTNNSSIELKFTLSEVPIGFEYVDISVTNGELGTLTTQHNDNTVYYATFTPDESGVSGQTECSISVPADKFTDAVGNYNTASNTFTFTFDNTKPTITIASTTVTSGSTTNNTPILLTFTLSEVPTGFEYADISVTNGELGNLTTSDNMVYYATFIPDESGVTGKTECSISVPADKFNDAVGNSNTASNAFTFTFDNTKPTITIESTTVASGSTTKNTPILLTFTLSEVPTGFEYADISVTNGALTALTGSDTVYYATFTPYESGVSGQTECSISVPADKFTDAVGNSNTASNTFAFTFDNTKPAITIASTTVTSGSTTKNTPILLTFTLSEVPTGFEYADISVSNGTLGTLTTSDNMVYYATFTPDENGATGKTECSISVPADKFTDAVGNYNTASNDSTPFTFTFDNTKPTITIESTTVTSGSTTKNTPILLTFTLSEVPTGFEYSDISVTNGALTALTGIDTVYTATFTPDESNETGKTQCSISVPAVKFIDAVGNSNTASNTFTFTFDNTNPTITIESTTVTSGSTTKNTPILLTFTLSEVPTGFEYSDISVTNGALTALTGSGTVYTAIFTPDENGVSGKTECSISVLAVKFTDAVGNYNTASNTFNFTFDNTKPGMFITATAGGSAVTSGSTTKNTPISLTFTLTEAITGFEYADISFTGGTLSPLDGDGTVYTATFTPDENGVSGKTECSISVPADKFIDAVGNNNTAAPTFNFTFDNTKPGMMITATASGSAVTSGSTTKNTPIELTFTLTEAITGFEYADISFTGGTLSPLAGGGSVYTATFTPDENGESGKTECSISVPADKFIDAVGNNNTAAPTFNFTFDNTKPGMMITATASGSAVTSGSTTKNTPIELTFTLSEVPTGFDYTDISVTNGALTALTGSDTVYYATFTPDENGVSGKTECSISVPADKFTDAVGNYNTASNTFIFTFDNTKPTITIASTTVTSGSTTKNTPILLTFTLSEVPTGFEYADISITNGTLTAFTGSDTVYTATFTPDESGVTGKTECSISVPAVKFIDSVGNYNTASNTFAFTFDNTKPDITIASTTVTSGSTTNNSSIELTFTLSEVPTGFEYADISVTNGTLGTLTTSDNMVYYATFTPDENGATGKTECSILVPADKFIDAVGNSNTASNAFTFTFDNTKPTMTIESTTVTSGSTTKNASIELTFTLSEVSTEFEYSDISVTNGTLGTLTTQNNDNKVYYATFTPDENGATGKTECSISVPADKFTDAVGNSNTASNAFIFTFDNTKPTITIESTTVTSGSTTKNTPILLTFTLSELPAGFEYADISVTNGALGTLTTSDNKVYYATFTPYESGVSGQTECSISVPADKFTDAVGNYNTASNTFAFTFDNTKPTITVESTTVTSGSTTNNSSIELTFTLSEVPTGFEYADITVTGGTLSPLDGSGTVYTATFTPDENGVTGKTECLISVPADKFTDAVGNYNTASNTFTFSFDNTNPTITIESTTVTSGSTTKNTPILLTFTLSEVPTGFEYSDISVTNGALTALTGSDTVYYATFTPDENGVRGKTQCSISVPAVKFIDAVGNSNTASNTFNFTFDNTKPTITIESTTVTSGSTTKNTPIELTFTLSEVPTGFEYADISVTNGALIALTGSDTVYYATFTPDESGVSGQTECSISVPADKFTDAVGNYNTASNTFIFTFDNTKPTITIASTTVTSGSTTKNTPILLTFTLSEVPTGFEYADISVTNGTLTAFTGSDTVYTATFTPDASGVSGKTECSISVPADKFTDAVGNYNTASTPFIFTFDNTKPTITIASTTVTNGSITKNTPILLTFTFSKVPTGFDYADISVTNGTLTALTGTDTVYTATFTPDESGVTGKTECSISVPEDKFTDAVGNYNTASNTFTFTFDSVRPTMNITATASGLPIANNATTNNAYIDLTFTSTESTTDFFDTDITVTNGALTNFAGSGAVYTATFTPTGQGACTIDVASGAYTDAATNLNNLVTQFTWTFDSVRPTMIITSNVANNATTNVQPITLTFTSSKATNNFAVEDITVSNGTLSSTLTVISETVYTATFFPIGEGLCTIDVAAGAYTDAVGNNNIAATQFTWTFDSVSPSMTITSPTIDTGSTTNNASIELTFTSSEPINGLLEEGIILDNGTLTNFAGSGSVYNATFTPIRQGLCTINVAAGAYTDAAGNSNTASNTFTWTFDSVSPTMTITSPTVTSGSTTNNANIALTFTSTEATTNFFKEDITVTNGTISAFTGSGTGYTAIFTPTGQGLCTIGVAAGAYTDAATNLNNLATQFTWTFDSVSPGMTITSTTAGVTSGSVTNNATIELTFTSTEATTNFGVGNIIVDNGELTNFAGSGTVYNATFTPIGQGLCTIDVAAGAYTDAVGNSNTAATTFNWTFDSVPPDMTITSTTVTSGSTTNNASIALTFTSTEATTNFVVGDITVTNGALTNFAGSGAVYTATFTPTGQGACTIDVAAGAYTDAATNLNNLATQFTWTFDSVPPDITITSTTVTSGSITDDATIELTFTSTKATNNFVVGNITVTNGALTNFAGIGTDGVVYTATFTPLGTGACIIDVAAGAYTDAAGNSNNAATRFNWTFGRSVQFDTNTLTIVNSIGANATDIVLFVLPYGEEMSNINVTAFTGTGTITYDLSTDGESINGGTFSGIGTNLLGTNVLIAPTNTTFSGRGANLRGTNASTNTTYILTLAANDSLTYTIVGTKRVNYGDVIPTELSFVNNTLTIQNNINSTDVDKVSFHVNADSQLYLLEVRSLLNTNRIRYVLDISGGSTVSSGSFTKAGVNLLNEYLLEQEGNRTYILTLTSRGTNTYSIVAMLRNNPILDINKFCSKQGIACNNVGYNRLVTSTNNPSVSNKMRYSQLLRSRRFKPVKKIGTSVPPPKPEIPLYLFATGQIFVQSVFR